MRLILSGFFLGFGVLWMILTAIGIHKYQNFFYKIHIASKGPTLGLMMILIGVVLHFWTLESTLKCLATIVFVFITVPVSSSLIALTRYEEIYGKVNEDS